MNRKFVLILACCAASFLAACNESVHLEYKCSDGERRCDHDKIMVCRDGEMTVETTCNSGMLCDPSIVQCADVSQITCSTDGEHKCEDNRVMACKDGRWNVEKACSETETCNSETFECDGGNPPELCNVDGERKCEDNRVMVCEDTWIVEKSCNENEVCNEETFECDPKTVSESCSEEGTKRCSEDASQIETCTNNVWEGENCAEGLSCVTADDGPLCAECDNEDTRCVVEDGVSMLSKCVNYTWAEAEACLETDAEKQVCDANPGKSCVNVLELLQCPEEGNVACQDVYGQEYAVICENGVVTQASGVCEEGLVCYVPEGGCTTPDICGNETVGAGEDCEEGMLGEATCATVTGDEHASGQLACLECKYDLTDCLYCGDDVVNNSEVCDGSVPEDATCTSVINDGKIYTGTLTCKDDCTFDLSNCKEEVVEDCTPENCTTTDPNATAACEENACKITCKDGFTDVEGVCTSTSCTAEDTQCSEDTFYKCSDDGVLTPIPKPDDGKHYICNASEGGWVEVECLDASHCSTTDVNATIDCVDNACVVTCKDKFTDVDGVCTEVVCEPGVNTCEDINLMVCNAKGTGYELVEPCATTDPNATATCEANACKVACNINFIDVGGVCTPIVCESGVKACNGADLMACNEKGTDYDFVETCANAPENATALCNDTEGACSFECNDGYLLNTEGTGCDREILACNFQWISADAGAFGNVALNGKTKENYEGRLVCIDQTDSTKIVTLDAVFNKDVDSNVEFGVLDLSGIDSGTYNCTFEFKLAASSSWYACQGVDYSDTWATPILIDGDDYTAIPATGWYREYIVQLCTPGSKVCDGSAQYKVCDSEGLSYGAAQACLSDPNGVASCSGEGECTLTCNEGYKPNADITACLPVICTPNAVTCNAGVLSSCNADGTEMTTSSCPTPDHATASCNGNACDFVCDYGYEKDSTGTACQAGFAVGSIVTFGHYEQDNNISNGKEPVTWIVLDRNETGQYLVLSKKALDVKPYNITNVSVTWETSTIRSWLNGYGANYNTNGANYTNDNFINKAFTADEKLKIATSYVEAHAYSSTKQGNSTMDKIFLLSHVEAKKYLTSSSQIKAQATNYAVANGAKVTTTSNQTYYGSCPNNTTCYSIWWLRTQYPDNKAAIDIYDKIGSGFQSVSYTFVSVRPAMWVDL